ncbi:uncharacterized protein B0H18DRAFT_395584 [Fomitopsis serialis]|uniref:uncharacterized protein n=1 Tax=Fomitopsis serialis TaxID=139415 RepID=UPI002008CA35|nr:uncharacterized protein B0H18DRAFT_395584 [Neoantrodia serialis]KAH9924912.1 hypothetical protein B0H18DRAFT_395584 [Neoantrodia serialis]
MRQSTAASSRQSTVQNPAMNAAAQARLLEKKKEYEAVAALERASMQFVKRIDELGDDFDVMADAGKVCGQVLEQWPNMFRILGLFLSAREQHQDDATGQASEGLSGERLVRVPIDEIRSSEDKT